MADTTQAPQIDMLSAEINQLKDAMNVAEAKNQAANQTIGEVMNANLNLRAATLLHQKQNSAQAQQISAQAQQIADYQKKIESLNVELASVKNDLENLTAPASEESAA